MSARSCKVNRKLKTSALSARCSETPSRVPNSHQNSVLFFSHHSSWTYQSAQHQRKDDQEPSVLQHWLCFSLRVYRQWYVILSTAIEGAPMCPTILRWHRDTGRTKFRITKSSDGDYSPCVGMVSMHLHRGSGRGFPSHLSVRKFPHCDQLHDPEAQDVMVDWPTFHK